MALLRISGIPLPILIDSASHKPIQARDNERAEDFTLIINRQQIKETYRISIVPQAPAAAFAFRDLVLGKGECWNFDTSVYGSKGSGPSALTNSVINGTAKYGAGGLQQTLSTGTVSYVVLPAGGTKWTVMVWRKLGAGAFVHYVVTETTKAGGQAWVNGVLQADATAWLVVTTSTGTVTLNADAAQTTNLDDLVIFPFSVPTDWPSNIQALGRAFSQLAYLEVDGDLIENNVGTKTVAGEVVGMPVMRANLGGTVYKAVQVVQVELQEI